MQSWQTGREQQQRKKLRSRKAFNETAQLLLEHEFQLFPYLTPWRKNLLSQQLNLTEKQIRVWFQNRRMRFKNVQRRRIKSMSSSVKNIYRHSSQCSHGMVNPAINIPKMIENHLIVQKDNNQHHSIHFMAEDYVLPENNKVILENKRFMLENHRTPEDNRVIPEHKHFIIENHHIPEKNSFIAEHQNLIREKNPAICEHKTFMLENPLIPEENPIILESQHFKPGNHPITEDEQRNGRNKHFEWLENHLMNGYGNQHLTYDVECVNNNNNHSYRLHHL